MSEKTGGPAFPAESDQYAHLGMTLRDYFAAKALQGICAHTDTWGLQVHGIAEEAYHIADAMLKARST